MERWVHGAKNCENDAAIYEPTTSNQLFSSMLPIRRWRYFPLLYEDLVGPMDEIPLVVRIAHEVWGK